MPSPCPPLSRPPEAQPAPEHAPRAPQPFHLCRFSFHPAKALTAALGWVRHNPTRAWDICYALWPCQAGPPGSSPLPRLPRDTGRERGRALVRESGPTSMPGRPASSRVAGNCYFFSTPPPGDSGWLLNWLPVLLPMSLPRTLVPRCFLSWTPAAAQDWAGGLCPTEFSR